MLWSEIFGIAMRTVKNVKIKDFYKYRKLKLRSVATVMIKLTM